MKTETKNPELLTVREAARYLSVGVSVLNSRRCIGGGPRFVKIMHSVRYRRSDLDDYIAGRTFENVGQARAAMGR